MHSLFFVMDRDEVTVEAIKGLGPASVHSFEVLICDGSFVDYAYSQRHRRFSTPLFEGHGIEVVEHGIPVSIEGTANKNQAVWLVDFLEGSGHRIDNAVGSAHVDADRSPDANVEFTHRVGEAVRSPPLGNRFRIGPHFEDKIPGRVEHPRNGEIPSSEFRRRR